MKTIIIASVLILAGCGGCDTALQALAQKKQEIVEASKVIPQPLFSTHEFSVAKDACEPQVFEDFYASL